MKKLFSLLLLVGALCMATLNSCDKAPDKVITEHVGYQPGATVKDAPVEITKQSVEIHMSYGEAVHYAANGIFNFLGVILLIAGAWAVYTDANDKTLLYKDIPADSKDPGLLRHIGLPALLLLLALASFLSLPSYVFANNNPQIPLSQYEANKSDLKPVWDSLAKECAIEGGPHDCWDKDNKKIK